MKGMRGRVTWGTFLLPDGQVHSLEHSVSGECLLLVNRIPTQPRHEFGRIDQYGW